jgi:hypothetical protein
LDEKRRFACKQRFWESALGNRPPYEGIINNEAIAALRPRLDEAVQLLDLLLSW